MNDTASTIARTPPQSLEGARILLVNDDGIKAPGIAVLERIARRFTSDIWIVAPESEKSGTGAGISMFSAVRAHRHGEKTYAVGGTATDCVLLGLVEILRDSPPDLVLSGVNRGANIAEDLLMSGTAGAALIAGTLGVPAVALSQQYADHSEAISLFDAAETHAPEILARLAAAGWPKDTIYNVNFPSVPPENIVDVVPTRQGRRGVTFELPRMDDPRRDNHFYFFIGPVGPVGPTGMIGNPASDTDLAALADKCISVTPISCTLTATPALESLRDTLSTISLQMVETNQEDR